MMAGNVEASARQYAARSRSIMASSTPQSYGLIQDGILNCPVCGISALAVPAAKRRPSACVGASRARFAGSSNLCRRSGGRVSHRHRRDDASQDREPDDRQRPDERARSSSSGRPAMPGSSSWVLLCRLSRLARAQTVAFLVGCNEPHVGPVRWREKLPRRVQISDCRRVPRFLGEECRDRGLREDIADTRKRLIALLIELRGCEPLKIFRRKRLQAGRRFFCSD